MNELLRVQALEEYKILDTLPEKEFDDIVELASAICGAPASLISIIGSDKVWHKAKVGTEVEQLPREYAFCYHMLDKPDENLIVNDLTEDARFVGNPMVANDPNIRFYGGFPLVTEDGFLLGSLCVLDDKPRNLTDIQQRSLELLSVRVMESLNARKEILQNQELKKQSEEMLQKLTNTAPGAFFQLEISADGNKTMPFVSSTIAYIFNGYTADMFKADYKVGLNVIHADDIAPIKAALLNACNTLTEWNVEFRIICKDKGYRWYKGTAQPEKRDDGTIVLYGTIQEITEAKEYTKAIEQQYAQLKEIAWMQSHLLRAPAARIQGLVQLLVAGADEAMPEEEIHENLLKSSDEMDDIIRNIVEKTQVLNL